MADATISVIIPTIGRDTLAASVKSCAGADEIIVIVDEAKAPGWTPEQLDAPVRLLRVDGGDFGYTARTAGIAAAAGTHLAFLDDDDVYADGAVELMREHACDLPVIFRMNCPRHGVIWRRQVVQFTNVGTPMFLVPNLPDQLGVWAPQPLGRGGDFTFIKGCCDQIGEPVWRDEIIAIVRPQEQRRRAA